MSATAGEVLILGAGINGAALARELALNGVRVCLVDTADIASGTTAYSSRLIHGGLRYLEYAEFDLVRESLEERTRLLRTAPHLVEPLRLFIPVENRFGGVVQSARRFLHLGVGKKKASKPRGLWLVKMGLRMYDAYARDPTLPKHDVHGVADPDAIAVDADRYRWLCSYWDAQIRYAERFTVALLEDARQLAAEQGAELSVYTYHRASRRGSRVEIRPVARGGDGEAVGQVVRELEPAAIVNATGAWVDDTLEQLEVPSERLIGGTKGTHFLTDCPRLCERLRGRGLYAEAVDGRPIFCLPLDDFALVGTTDEPFEGRPENARATPEELDYLISSLNGIFGDLELKRDDVDMHYAGVRPLPYVGPMSPAAITRRHRLDEHPDAPMPMFSIIGGKLTTCRSLAESSAATILERLGGQATDNTRERPLPGGGDYPPDEATLEARRRELAERFSLAPEQVRAIWSLEGTRTGEVLAGLPDSAAATLADSAFPRVYVRWVVETQWVRRLVDVVERRLMLLFQPRLTWDCLRDLAAVMAECGVLEPGDAEGEVRATAARLEEHFGKRVSKAPSSAQPRSTG